MYYNELDLCCVGPQDDNLFDKTFPSKLVILGKSGRGKSVVIDSLLYYWRNKINQGLIISGSEDSNGAYAKHFPSLFIYNEYSEEPIKKLIEHQKALIQAKVSNPWSILVIDDCAFDKKFFSSTLQNQLFKNARHWFIVYILAIQFARDIPLTIRSAVDMTFILREDNMQLRRIIYDNYAAVIPTFNEFVKVICEYTRNFGVLVIDNMRATETWEESVFYFRAEIAADEWKFGNENFWKFSK